MALAPARQPLVEQQEQTSQSVREPKLLRSSTPSTSASTSAPTGFTPGSALGSDSGSWSSAASLEAGVLGDQRTVSAPTPFEDGEGKGETLLSMGLQVFFPFILAGLGMVAAGLVLDVVVKWDVFIKCPEILILVPALLGMKGNLEMTLASRLSTAASLGQLDRMADALPLLGGNLALLQVQSIVVGFLGSVVATGMSYSTTGEASLEHSILLCSSAMTTASLASFVLGCVMILVVVVARKAGCDPDNVAAPIAASLGDITTLVFLANIANAMWSQRQSLLDETLVVIYVVCLLPVFAYLTSRNASTKEVLIKGWTPVLASMCISSAGGLILDSAIESFPKMAAFQPVINGAGSNLAAVQASRIATHLHRKNTLGTLEEDVDTQRSCSPFSVFSSQSRHGLSSRVLMFLVVPGHIIFLLTIWMTAVDESVSPNLVGLYLPATLLQEWVLLYACLHLVHSQWRRGVDPDSAAVPYIAALGDLVGTSLLLATFVALTYLDKEEDIKDAEVESLKEEMTQAKFLMLRHAIPWRRLGL